MELLFITLLRLSTGRDFQVIVTLAAESISLLVKAPFRLCKRSSLCSYAINFRFESSCRCVDG